MALSNVSSNASKICKSAVVGAVMNSAYLTRGVTQIPETKTKGERMGDEFTFVTEVPKAMKFNGERGANAVNLQDKTEVIKASVKLEEYGVMRAYGDYELALQSSKEEDFGNDVGAEIANTAAWEVAVSDMSKIAPVVASDYKGLAKASAKLRSTYNAKQYGFADPMIIGELQGEGRNLVPVSVDEKFGVGLEGKFANIDELRTMNLPKVNGLATTVAATIATDGTVTLGSSQSKGLYLVGKGTNKWIVNVAADGTAGKTAPVATAVSDAKGLGAAEYSACIIRCEKAQAYGDAGDALNIPESGVKKSAEGVTIAEKKHYGSNNYNVDVMWATAFAAGIIQPSKASVILMEV